MRVLVTGGAGYIGGHVVRLLLDRAEHVVVVDDLVSGLQSRVRDAALVEMDLASDGADQGLAAVMHDHRIDSVIHFAARKQVAESVARPAWYYQQNLGSLARVLEAADAAGVARLVFSSSAAVYGPEIGTLSETSDTRPLNPYGETKLAGEWLVAAAARASGFSAVSLRYFNVAGAGRPELGDRAALNLVPMVFDRLDAGLAPVIFGDDYPTVDGTCVRDFVHVLDVADAHLAALDQSGDAGTHAVYNVGTGNGVSVRQMIDAILERAASDLVPEVRERRPGDAPHVVASVDRIERDLGWRARFGLDEIVASAWESHRVLTGRP